MTMNLNKRRTVEQVYDDMSYFEKESAGLPIRFYMLTTEQASFLENFADLLDKPDEDELLSVRELVAEALDAIESVINKGE
jgi:hypothetical protein